MNQRRSSTRPPLTRERIESEALALIEREGMEAFSMRRLGQALGCEAMSLYNHFPSKAHVLDALVDRVLAGIPIPDRHLAAGLRLRQLARHWRAMARPRVATTAWMGCPRAGLCAFWRPRRETSYPPRGNV